MFWLHVKKVRQCVRHSEKWDIERFPVMSLIHQGIIQNGTLKVTVFLCLMVIAHSKRWIHTHTQEGKWDLLICHPPCTYLTNAGARWLYAGKKLNKERYEKGIEAKEFFMKMLNADCDHIAVENPVPSSIFDIPKYSQVIQPYEFGHPYSKKTCLWLKGLPTLKPTKIISEFVPYCSSGSYSRTHDEKYKGASRKGGAAKSRSKTFQGIAKAMADQWSELS